jgi:hypothetical protein
MDEEETWPNEKTGKHARNTIKTMTLARVGPSLLPNLPNMFIELTFKWIGENRT